MATTFSELKSIAALARRDESRVAGRERLVRFLDTYAGSGSEQAVVDALCAEYGLYPYMSDSVEASDSEVLAIELHTPEDLADESFVFHAEQRAIYSRLMDGENVILSAPTSFGKSAILDALVASNKWSVIVIIVPTIALIDETRRRLARFRGLYSLVTNASAQPGPRAIYIMTQERYLETKIDRVDLFIIDEFYKLGLGDSDDQRLALLNLAWKRLRSSGAQYYLIGPNISSLPDALERDLDATLTTSNFRTVAVDIIDRSHIKDEDRAADLMRLMSDELTGSTLVFASAPERAEILATSLTGAVEAPVRGGLTSNVAEWVADNFHPQWRVVEALRGGVAVHHGVMPRSLQRTMVRLFNEGNVPLMVCTSTLIEGVNTSARNVVIYDHKIDGQLLDFFTFSNIRGRAGRMSRHFVGRVVTYAEPPADEQLEIDFPIESQSPAASEATLAQLDWEDLDEPSRARMKTTFEQQDLSLTTIRANRGVDPASQIALARRLSGNREELARLGWSGRYSPDQLRLALEVTWDELVASRQRRGVNFAMVWGQLQNARINAESFHAAVTQQVRYLRAGRQVGDAVLDVFRFQRNWMGFRIPALLRTLQAVQQEVAQRYGAPVANYDYAVRQIEGLYLAPNLAALDEYGIPVPLAVKLGQLGLHGDTVDELLAGLTRRVDDTTLIRRLTSTEQWILRDAVEGLVGVARAG